MRAYLMSIMVIGIALGAAGLGTYAWFTDSETLADNTLATGTFQIDGEFRGVDGSGTLNYNPLKLEGLVPSASTWHDYYFVFWNWAESDDAAKMRITAEYVPSPGSTMSLDQAEKVQLQAVWNPHEYDYAGETYTKYTGGMADDTPLTEYANLKQLLSSSTGYDSVVTNMPPRHYAVIKLRIRLSEDAGNEFQNLILKFKVKVEGVQAAGEFL